ncbi:MAG: glycosyltransferase [Saprospiraceae bacterium]|nr:glycosyltransferase [Saprospiraceae bacterium]
MPDISIVIVNYKVKHFLRQCLQSIYNASHSERAEIIVVDNNSQDGSLEMIQAYFPEVKLIANTDNKGFSKANNQGFEIAQGRYTLILNPDTILEEDTLKHCWDYMENHPNVGAMGVKMMDGSGEFLPESKRGFPSPTSAFFKIIGLNALFPGSKIFNQYYLGHLKDHSEQNVEVLTGAFMFCRTDVLKQVGGFDEDYFMYGEDIELSYQIKQAGYDIIYSPASKIIHFKGESTNKQTLSYTRNFYGAMQKYASKRQAGGGLFWRILIAVGIVFTAMANIFKSMLKRILRPMLDIVLLFSVAKLFQSIWARFYFNDPMYYAMHNTDLILLLLSSILIFCYYLFGQYDRRHNIKHLVLGFVSGALFMLTVYSLLPEQFRFSRVVLVVLAMSSPFLLFFTRKFYNLLLHNTSRFSGWPKKRFGIIGSDLSFIEIQKVFHQSEDESFDMAHIEGDEPLALVSLVRARKINDLVFCSKDISTQDIFKVMSLLGDKVSYKIANDDNSSILGSDSKNHIGEWYTMDISFKIDQKFHRRLKRIFDLTFGVLILITFPIWILLTANSRKAFFQAANVLIGSKTWIGYKMPDPYRAELPNIRNGVFELPGTNDATQNHQINTYYARKYNIWLEVQYMIQLLF